jgi:molybdopterin-containing oxidoreductase family iron-sulfur binding subunit
MNENRRNFLKNAGRTALGIGCGFPLLSAGCGVLEEASGHGGAKDSQLAMIVDVEKCLDPEVRDACVRACNRAHSIPTEIPPQTEDGKKLPNHQVKWIWTEDYEHAFPEQTHAHTAQKDLPVLVLCNHCTQPPCVKVCPTQATWKRESDGIVTMDMHRCIGCRYCIAACPYGSRSFNWLNPRPYITAENSNPTYPTRTKGVVEKCNFCVERLRDGQGPACVEAVQKLAETKPEVGGALKFGTLADEAIRNVLNDEGIRTICRKPGLGTEPNVFYIV